MDKEIIEIPKITLDWTDWAKWDDLKVDLRFNFGISVPNESGVYEAKLLEEEERLTIGKASNLRMRVKQGLAKGKLPHSAGEKIREKEDTSKIVVRWATTERPCAVEEELHKKYMLKFSRLPKYVDHT
ncbi:MAG: hypothetical protein ABSF36_03410 [Candidatus Methanomethylicaceae archaeon]|jgi:excinuclease UvrABC nuclease subunit